MLTDKVLRTEESLNTELFDNLITIDELLLILKKQYSRHSVYKWVRQGMPHRKIRGKLWFPKDEAWKWLERTS